MKRLFGLIFVIFALICCTKSQDFKNAIEKSRKLIEKFKSDESIPGLAIGINYNGKQVWVQSYGYSDIENDVEFRTDTVMRTGSVSKPIGTALAAKLVEQSKINWDYDIHQYIDEKLFPRKQWKGEAVDITVRQLISMTGGIRTYDELKDFRSVRDCHNVTETLAYFSADLLVAKPGTKFYYSNWAWHLIGAIMEIASEQNYEIIMNKMFAELAMNSTRLSRRELIIKHRSRPYSRALSTDGKAYVIKSALLLEDLGRPLPWLPAGAVITSVPDLLTFTQMMLKSYKTDDYLKSKTVKELWTPRLSGYGMGWYVSNYTAPIALPKQMQYIHHSGEVAGSVCMMGLVPELDISVALIANLGGVKLDSIGLSVLNNFVEVIE